ncbi:hypothetical protein C5167_048418 [Papaver somniferum]|uniref:Uncharacterized protein n=1 Tax=Papaver somniferum TaxID=3469 RepID=A0A4Y7KHW7_PAPSO|nr:hypothetical protein C5167_048418 [Papaver somniferum]
MLLSSSTLIEYKNLAFQIGLSILLTLILTMLQLPIRFLEGLNTKSGFRPAIRRPSDNNTSHWFFCFLDYCKLKKKNVV